MSDIRGAVVQHLKAQSAITSLVGVGNDARIYEGRIKQGAPRPSISVGHISGDSETHLSGILGVGDARIQVEAWADRPSDAYDVAEAVRLSTLGFFGTMGTVEVSDVTMENRFADDQDVEDGSDLPRHRYSADYLITYSEAV